MGLGLLTRVSRPYGHRVHTHSCSPEWEGVDLPIRGKETAPSDKRTSKEKPGLGAGPPHCGNESGLGARFSPRSHGPHPVLWGRGDVGKEGKGKERPRVLPPGISLALASISLHGKGPPKTLL